MKSPFRKVRRLGLHKHDKRHRHQIQRSFTQLDELSQASQDMEDMRDCYDRLLSAAASTTNTVYEFSESLQEMGGCLLEKTALSNDEDSGRVLIMLGKTQFSIQKLLDNYRSHISQTITVPSESLLNELHIVEDMKKQCDEKRRIYEAMKMQYEKGRMKSSKEEFVSSRQLQSARDEFDEDATLFIFRMKSLKRAQSRSLLTQAARHYAAQMCLFRKALKSLEEIEPHVKLTTEQQHIDYLFSGLEEDDRDSVFLTDDDDDEEEDDEDVSDDNYEALEDSELNIESRRNVGNNEVSTSGNTIELDNEDVTFPRAVPVKSAMVHMNGKSLHNSTTFGLNKESKSAPLSVESTYERYQQMRQSSTRKLNTYVLPTPLEKSSVTSRVETQPPKPKPPSNNMWHSMPLEKISGKPTPLPAPQMEVNSCSASSAKKIKIYAFSGPLTGDSQSKKTPLYASGPIGSTARHLPVSGSLLRSTSTHPLSTSEAYSLSGSIVSLPVISELHELPRPPAKVVFKKPSKVGFSAPLATFKREPDVITTSKSVVSDAAYTLPVPSTSQRDTALGSRQTETVDLRAASVMVSPPLSPIIFRDI